MKKGVIEAVLLIACLSMLIYFLPFTGHDVFSVNSGGGNSASIAPTSPIARGSFFIQLPATPSPKTTVTTSNNGGGSGSGSGLGTSSANSGIRLNVSSLDISMSNNTNKMISILVTNIGNSSVNISVSQQNLSNIFLLQGNSSFSLGSDKGAVLAFLVVAPSKPGVYNGNITIGGVTIPVVINVKNQLNLFDSRIKVLNSGYVVQQGTRLRTQVTLLPRGNDVRVDTTLNYSIVDSSGKSYLNNSETLLVNGNVTINRDFDTSRLPPGNYTISLSVYYPEGIAPSSAQFEVIPRTLLGNIIYYSIMSLIGVAILVVLILIIRTFRKRKDTELI